MSDFETDEQRMDSIRQWWRDNGKQLTIGILLAITGLLAWQWWQTQQVANAQQASALFQKLLAQANENNTAMAQPIAQQLMSEYPSNAQSALAAMLMAKLSYADNDTDQAERFLSWVLRESDNQPLQAIARLRLASLFINQKQWQQAENTLNQIASAAFEGQRQALLGQLYQQTNRLEKAQQALQNAIAAGNDSPLVTLQKDSIGLPAKSS